METGEGWLYLAAIVDLYESDGRGLGHGRDRRREVSGTGVTDGSSEPGARGLLHHSDRGSEFTSERYQAALREVGVQVSMSRTGNVSDNAAMESFFATLTRGMSQSNALSHTTRGTHRHF